MVEGGRAASEMQCSEVRGLRQDTAALFSDSWNKLHNSCRHSSLVKRFKPVPFVKSSHKSKMLVRQKEKK